MRSANLSVISTDLRQRLKRLWAACLLPLYKHTILVLSLIFCSGTLLALWYLSHATTTLMQSAALQGITMHAESLMELRNLYTSEVVDRLGDHNIEVTHDYLDKPGAIPLPATFSMELGRRISLLGSGMVVRLYSNYPFPWRKDGGARDDFEQQALAALQANPQQPYYRFEDFQGRASLRYATADVMHAECISCHNARPDSPKHDWKVGDVRGVLEIVRPLDRVVAQSRADLRDVFILFGTLLALGLGGLALVITRLRRVSVDLEDQVVHRTTQLAAANQELEAFSYSVSHDLRAPLRSIDGFSRALLDDYSAHLDETGKDYLQRVRAATQRMGQLIDDMLKLSRVTRSEMNFETVNLSILAQTVADELQQAQPERHVEFVCTPGMTVRGDAHLLKVALENLLGNAWKFTSKREQAHIEIGVTHQVEASVYFVRDNGAGFDMAYVSKLFSAFQRLHAMTEFPGTGIGLATVQRIIHRHGGRVWAEGEPGKGSTFYFTLP
ncbi:ATP-binding protein [Candidatus Nitrotoga sp. AM1P]|uniref:ATP-binding protein n=1 Tax=Candidatus Nitrotoga sp. AM1P TaxID=2559597 RepID=UPI001F552840|nr:ATP-binding protein [Candidatus Nitrotoga sp. AM1P]